MVLLWRGLGRYVRETGADWLFGCSSLPTQDPEQIQAVSEALAPGFDASLGVKVRPGSRLPTEWHGVEPALNPMPVPALLNSYLRIGARIAPTPAHDPEFRCVDFFTALDIGNLDAAARRFL